MQTAKANENRDEVMEVLTPEEIEPRLELALLNPSALFQSGCICNIPGCCDTVVFWWDNMI